MAKIHMKCSECSRNCQEVCPRCQKPICGEHQDELDGVCDTCTYEAGEQEERYDRQNDDWFDYEDRRAAWYDRPRQHAEYE